MKIKNQLVKIFVLIAMALFLRFVVVDELLLKGHNTAMHLAAIAFIFIVGFAFVFRGTAKTIEETTDVLKDRTGLAGGLLQALGTAFPDMIIGVVAAIMAIQVRDTDPIAAVNLAIIAAAATFGSNIYNIIHAYWCVLRQNLANAKNAAVLMFPPFKFGGTLKPISDHKTKPSITEMDVATKILAVLSLLTTFVAMSMVAFGKVTIEGADVSGDLYQLIAPLGCVLFILCVVALFSFRKSHRPKSPIGEVVEDERYYAEHGTIRIWFDLLVSGVAILFTAESMVKAMEIFSEITSMPFVVTGILAGFIGCFGEMLVIHNFSVNPKGRIGDAIVGVAMDNIVTTMGAAVVAIMGGIFLGGSSLIIIFMIILCANTLLLHQISKLKNSLPAGK